MMCLLTNQLREVETILFNEGFDKEALIVSEAFDEIERLRAAAVGVPDGWQLVPKDLTPAMAEAGAEAGILNWSLEPGEGLDGVDTAPAWEAILAAAPPHPAFGFGVSVGVPLNEADRFK